MFGKSRANFSWDDLWCNPPNPTPRKKLRLLARSCSARLCARPSTDFSVMGLFDCWLISSSLKAWRSLVFSYKDVFFVISDGIVFLKVQCILFIYEGQVQVWCVVYSVRNKCKRHMIEDMSFLVCATWWFMTKELGPIFYECKQVVFSTGKVGSGSVVGAADVHVTAVVDLHTKGLHWLKSAVSLVIDSWWLGISINLDAFSNRAPCQARDKLLCTFLLMLPAKGCH